MARSSHHPDGPGDTLVPSTRRIPPISQRSIILEGVELLTRAVVSRGSSYQLTRDIGSTWEYGNLDVALLGHALAHRAGVDVETLVQQRITGPLRMTGTGLHQSPSMTARLSSSHDSDLRPRPPGVGRSGACRRDVVVRGRPVGAGWSVPRSHAVAARRSAAVDAPAPDAPIQTVFGTDGARELAPDAADDGPASAWLRPPVRYFTRAEAAMGWFVLTEAVTSSSSTTVPARVARRLLRSIPKRISPVVVLSNTGRTVQDISRHLLRRDFPLSAAKREVDIDPAVLDRYVGQYQPQRGVLFDIRRRAVV